MRSDVCPFHEIGHSGEVEFRFLAVVPSAWGLGVGASLIEACAQHARRMQSNRLVISVRDTNVGALSAYRKLGFARLPERDWQPIPTVSLLALHRTVEISATP